MDALGILASGAGGLLGLYYLLMVLRSDTLWNWLLGIDESVHGPSVFTYENNDNRPIPPWPSYALPAPKIRLRKNFGSHRNPLALTPAGENCDGEFEQMDARTWQCLKCQMLHFEKLEGEGL